MNEQRATLPAHLERPVIRRPIGRGVSSQPYVKLNPVESPVPTYLALSELAQRWEIVGTGEERGRHRATSLSGHELRVFSQNGEDGVLAEIFQRIGVTGGGFVEFGVETGREGNCVFLADVLGWPGVFMEADPDCCHHLVAKYRWSKLVRVVFTSVTPENVEELFTEAGVPPEPDVVSIDVDGQDVWIWKALRAFRPRVVVIEYNATIDPNTTLVEPRGMQGGWQGTDFYGASLGALISVGDEHGYTLVYTELAGVNAFFVRNDLAGPFAKNVLHRGPNYFLTAAGHPQDQTGRAYDELA